MSVGKTFHNLGPDIFKPLAPVSSNSRNIKRILVFGIYNTSTHLIHIDNEKNHSGKIRFIILNYEADIVDMFCVHT